MGFKLMKEKTKHYLKSFVIVLLFAISILVQPMPVISSDSSTLLPQTNQPINVNKENLFDVPVTLLVGLSSSELSYREISALSGFELFTVPYRADIKNLVEQIKPSQIIIKHPSGFTGLYTPEGQLVRGIQTIAGLEVSVNTGTVPPSIIQPEVANPVYENVYYPGANTGEIPLGGVGYTPPPRGRGLKRHLLKLLTFTGILPFQYPGYFKDFGTTAQKQLVPSLLFPHIQGGIAAAAQYADAKLDAAEYENARTQPRDYMFQPVIEGY